MTSSNPRYRVSNIGYAYAVHDTQVPQDYVHPAGREKEHPSKNLFNTRIVEVVPTYAEARRIAEELERRAAG